MIFLIPLITISNFLNISMPNLDDQPGPMSLSKPSLIKSSLKNSDLLIQRLLLKRLI